MTIATVQAGVIGSRSYAPEGPFGTAGNFPWPAFKPGEVNYGDAEGEWVYVLLPVVSAFTLNQGDWLVWDNSYMAVVSQTGSGVHPFGANCGTFFLGGRVAAGQNNTSAGNIWSYTFSTTGIYGIWVQRAGISIGNVATINAQTKPLNTTAVNGQMNAPAAPLAGSMGTTGVFTAPLSFTFTGTTTTGSAILTAASQNKGLVIGQSLSGTGVATGAVIKDIQGSTVTMSLVATATGTVTITAQNGQFFCTTTNASPNLTNVTSIAGIYPNQTLTGTGIAGATTVLSVLGNSAPYTIVMSANATATANNITVAATVYYEILLRWPYIGSQN